MCDLLVRSSSALRLSIAVTYFWALWRAWEEDDDDEEREEDEGWWRKLKAQQMRAET
jgi:hypothetical protein